ncbi:MULTISPECIES: two-partner secretion domain-containing protein [unclassified Tolypothrix]|uniref:two-partner secretion domain-containing protein n=1 Tax=unclassified Tolypothrix TaxID=2649714 RepID=UPI0005EAC306|nr:MULTISPECIES: S-layer family protein [unclassified Tolypothrix]BAY89342.1 filamentous hemagglutinin-like protein [Microchaete diplosiphon NIES-3275]EKE97692.1 protein, filamentous hemagglutinin family [Tolypothrix sp. PCC 7601]MBE9084057.1 S-layer family protein [Tolypothrix sp. LEGE 11397]UYD23620.1 S-layer family protein [Tolypothrix sp. PCC 7712]UYD34153.1 S-layer family protein [Tolypothrix sp. PCC 7601]
MKVIFAGLGLIGAIFVSNIYNSNVYAQVIPDSTLNTSVTETNNYNITNGSRVGNNLFHSFSQFSVPSNGSAVFNNATDIQNIFSRVTGGNVSNINGSIRAQGNANLFLINPAGIIFGQNASLNIGGSFIGTTANSIKFADGIEFSAVNTSGTSLLTMSVPIGLQMGQVPANITVQGTGSALIIGNSQAPVIRVPSPTKLQVQPGKTLALVGGNLSLNGATLSAEQGQIELGSLGGTGLVSLVPTTLGYTLEYENDQSFADIQLMQKSLLDVSGFNSGSVQVRGKEIQFSDRSLILAQNFGNLPGGNLHLQSSAGIDLTGAFSGIRSENVGVGTGGNISVITPRLSIQEGGLLSSNTYGASASGNIQIDATKLDISGFSPLNSNGSVINTSTLGSGNAGNISVSGDSLLISDGGGLSSISRGIGSSGEVMIRNQDTIVQSSSNSILNTRISSTTFSTGNAKTLTLDTARLRLINGGTIGTSSFFVGHGGDIRINATESIQVSGRNQINPSAIASSSTRLNPALQKLFGIPNNNLTADAGTVSITTPYLLLKDGGTVSVTNQGSGNGGSINITANTIQLKNQAVFEAQTASGNGGNIGLQVGKLLLLRESSQITATAQGNGNGGNISIDAPILVGLENSDIIANAVQGKGGNIAITTQGIIGLEFRNTLTPRVDLTNDITASSEFNVNGTVEINNLGVDPNSGLVTLPANVSDSSQQIASGCSNNTGSSFVATGRGGIPQNPTQDVRSDRTWSDVRDISAFYKTGNVTAQIPTTPQVLIQATSWHRNAMGKIELVADNSPNQMQPALTCAVVPKI